jgi:phospholipase D1/2
MAETTAQFPFPAVTETPPPGLKVDTHTNNASTADGTLPSARQENRSADTLTATSARGSTTYLSPTPPKGTPKDESPDRWSPRASASRLPSSLKNPSRSRLAAQSPVNHLSDEIIAEEGPNGTASPSTAKKGVQFSNHNDESDARDAGPETPVSAAADRGEKQQTLYSRLRALASSQGLVHTRAASNVSQRSNDGKELDGHLSSATPRSGPGLFATLEEGDSDADAEESGAETATERRARPMRRHRKPQPRRVDDIDTAPSSPHSPMRTGMASAPLSSPPIHADGDHPRPLARAATDIEVPHDRLGMSEDEGRKRSLASSWTPRHPLRGLSYGGQRKTSDAGQEPHREGRQGMGLRMLTTLPSAREYDPNRSGETADTPKTSRRKLLTERTGTLSAQKWRQLRQKLQQFGQTKKKERTQDHQKSAQLLAELQAGGPAALMIASMFQRDENGARRIPVLLEQLKVRVTDSEIDRSKDPDNPTPSDRHIVFRIELEYGSGVNRMKWVINRSLRDFANLHGRYKLHFTSERFKGRADGGKEMPKFPRRAFPYLKDLGWNIEDFSDDEDDNEAQRAADGPGPETDTERPRPNNRPSFALMRRRSSIDAPNRDPVVSERERQQARKRLEIYLQRMINFMLFRADSNRLCKFLEVSALGVRLAAEGSYHGKEGFMLIQSAKGLDFRKALTPDNLKTLTNRYSPKWFLVRHSYVVCVDSPEEMHIYDVFLFDSDFRIQSYKKRVTEGSKAHEIAEAARETAKHPQHHRLKLYNSERKLKLLARTERQLHQFEASIRSSIATSGWCQPTRFDSFAPVRQKCFAQWLVDGRDHMWVVSRAINQAKDVIYIHDWWLSPELYMRRPPAISQKWRLDRLLKRKAEEGVKIFVIVYRNVESAIPIDSQYTKFSLLDLHPNVFVQRSPNQIRQNTFFWAHHEKICVIDHTVAFVGGVDLCFGRWDTPQHTLVDDKDPGFEQTEGPKDADHCQLWPGKDYSNPRVQDFYALNKPYEEMYDRQKTARMPWHDISMQVVGQPARDLTRHFVQRWNYILRQRKPTRPTPFLLPPPDFNPADLEALGLDGTCEIQILRSAGPWSMGTPDRTEHSIMNAYVKMIEESDHFVYIENQFFISSCQTERVTVHNKIGDALVERITRAHKKEEAWRATIVIPLIPGFQNTVEQEGGTSVRLIMQYQYRSICRGESSIFGRLRAAGIDPEEYIQFYSLRQWGRIGPNKALVTEQLYIHAKCMVVDDRVAIIGSANINERSMLGNRDSECAAIVRDTDMLWSRMNGQPYQVGRFPHTLRMRLMREHLGLDVDKIMEDAQAMEQEHNKTAGANGAPARPLSSDGVHEMPRPDTGKDGGRARAALDAAFGGPTEHMRQGELREELLARQEGLKSFNHDVDWEQAGNPNLKANRKVTEDSRVTKNEAHKEDVEGHGFDHMVDIAEAGLGIGRDSTLTKSTKEVLVADLDTEGRTTLGAPRPHGDNARLPSYVVRKETPNPPMPPRPTASRMNTAQLGLPMLSQLPALPVEDDTDIGGPPLVTTTSRDSTFSRHPLINEIRQPLLDRDCMLDPIHDAFADDTWHAIAENNTKIYRTVFRCMPDNLVRDWEGYQQYVAYELRFNQQQGNDAADDKAPKGGGSDRRTGPPGAGGTAGTVAAASTVSNLKKVPTDMQQNVKDLKRRLGGNKNEEDSHREKENLRAWAREANEKQAERQYGRGSPGNNAEPFPGIEEEEIHDEKTGENLLPIPDGDGTNSRLQTPSDNGTTVVAGEVGENNGKTTPSSGARTATADGEPARSSNEGADNNLSTTNNLSTAKTNASTTSTPPVVAPLVSDTLNHNAGQAALQHHGTNSVSQAALSASGTGTTRKRRRGTTRSSRRDFSASDDILSTEEAEELLGMVRGHLVLWPYDWYVSLFCSSRGWPLAP